MGSPYLSSLSSLLLTILLHLTMSSVVLATRRAPAGKGCRACPPYLCQVGRMIADPSMPASGRLPHVRSAMLAGQLSGGARTWQPVLRGRGGQRGLGKRSDRAELGKGTGRVSGSGIDSTEQELGKGLVGFHIRELIRPSRSSGTDWTERGSGMIRPSRSSGLFGRVNSSTNPEGLAEKVNSGINLGDLAEKANSGTNPGDLAERTASGINPEDLAERVNSGINPGDLAKRATSGTNPRDLAERVNSGMNPEDLAEKVNSSTNLGDLAEKVNSGTNPEDLVEKVNSGTNPGDLAERVNSGTNSEDFIEKADHDLDMAVTEGSLAMIRRRYSISVKFGLHVPQLGQRPYSSDAPDMCISVDALEADL
ncbi:hypothetical protein B296_00043010 [Ensete ventricosum]|uniref:SMP domain-containing protein n=1 Tax=Ensete ventricosum TaxID=4639 RepID=A0A426YWW0_ENSVE|nr:hypothetical protein B296_00043010 [Ensete ventricosum]